MHIFRRMPLLLAALFCLCVPVSAHAATAADAPAPSLAWGIPFAGVLLSIALVPMLAPRLWHRRMGTIAASWAAALLLPQALLLGPDVAAHGAWHAILVEYLPFVALLLALYTAAGGILVRGGRLGTPAGNTVLLAIGALIAGFMGTTGASIVLIHPLLRANAHRVRKMHLVVFFIVIVGNVGGASSPLGDPPLYIGFLRGVPFFWPLTALWPQILVLSVILLAAFFAADSILARSERPAPRPVRLHIRGWSNVALIAVVVATVLGQGVWQPGDAVLFGQAIGIERLAGIGVFVAVTLISVATTARAVRQRNKFTWEPITEVATLFAVIFVTIGPVLTMLQAGFDGPLAPLLRLTVGENGQPVPAAYFWLTGGLSAFLDNAPTYLVFFELASGDPSHLTTDLALVLKAISAGAVFFGALTYIGNAPNLMIKSIAAHRGVRMPGFFGYMAWSCALLLPCFALLTVLFYL